MNKRPKLFYIPGMISLLLLPVLFSMYLHIEKKQTVLKLVLPKEDRPEDRSSLNMRFSRAAVMAQLKGKKINTVYYDEDHELNEIKLDFITREAQKLKFYHDTTQIIKVRLANETTYNEFVQLVNVMYRDKHKRYVLLDNDFYILGEEPPQTDVDGVIIPFISCGFSQYHVVKTRQQLFWEQVNKYKLLIVNNVLLLSAFVLLIAVPVIIKRNRGY